MSQSLVFLIGLTIGLFGGIIIKTLFSLNAKESPYPSELDTFEAILEQYMQELDTKQREIQQVLTKLETYQPSSGLNKQTYSPVYQAKAEKVLAMLNQGYNYAEIAQKLGLGTGEVELIHQLKNNEIAH